MELVYLWVEENNLIKGTDFNFGSKYIFSFKKDDKENKGVLSVKDNPNFIENFYTNNISISAIVGKNGTGKSQLLRLIWNGSIENKQYFAIIFNNGYYELICAKHINNIAIFPDKIEKEYYIFLEKNVSKLDNLTNLFYTNEATCLESIYSSKTITDNLEFISKECHLKEIIDREKKYNQTSIKKHLEELKKNELKDIKLNLDTLLDEVEEKANEDNSKEFFKYDIDEQAIIDEVDNIEYKLDDIEVDVNKIITYEKIQFILDSQQFEKILNIIYDKDILWFDDIHRVTSIQLQIDEDKWKKEIQKYVGVYKSKKLFEKLSINQKLFLYYAYLWLSNIEQEENIDEEVRRKYNNIRQNYKILKQIDFFNLKNIFEKKKEFFNDMIKEYSYKKGNKEIFFSIAKEYFTYLKQLDESIVFFKDINNIELKEEEKSKILNVSKIHTNLIKSQINITSILRYEFYPKMSSGNLIIMQTFAMLYDKLKDIKDDNIILLLDEIEVYLHPNWQKKFLKLLIGFLSSKFKDKKFHVILATHSPFLLSDIPKSNVVFLGNDKVEFNQTFGANIHTLLSDSFFMENGLMGEFAKSKINKIIRFLNGKNKFIDFPIEEIIKVIENIGEPFLRSKMLDMYNRKFIKEHKEREKKKIEEQINQLKSKLKELDND